MDPRLWMATSTATKTFEKEIDILQMILESLVLLCQTRQIRRLLFKKHIFPVLRNLDLAQLDPKISDLINEIVQFLYRDEEENGVPQRVPLPHCQEPARKGEGKAFTEGEGGGNAADKADTKADTKSAEGKGASLPASANADVDADAVEDEDAMGLD